MDSSYTRIQTRTPEHCAQFEEGLQTDCEGAFTLVCDCASLAPGPLLDTFKEKNVI